MIYAAVRDRNQNFPLVCIWINWEHSTLKQYVGLARSTDFEIIMFLI